MKILTRWVLVAFLCTFAACHQDRGSPTAEQALLPADHVFTNGKVYTADALHSIAQAVAVRGNTIVYVGDDAGAQPYIGDQTEVHDLAGRLVLPGLHDTHIHPEGIVQPDICDLQSQPMTLEELAVFLRGCIDRR